MKLYKLLLTFLLAVGCWTSSFAQCPFYWTDIQETPISSGIQLSFIPNGAPGPYTYLWSDGSTNARDTVHSSGVYFVTVTDSMGCTHHPGDTITSLPCAPGYLTYTYLGNNQFRFTQHMPTTGHYNYSFLDWVIGVSYYSPVSQSGNTAVFTIDPNHTNNVFCNVYDSVTNCYIADSIYIYPYCTLGASITATGTPGATGILTAHATNAQGSLTYHWASSTSNILTVANPGNYCVTITDTAGCTATACQNWQPCNMTSLISHSHTATNVYTFVSTTSGGAAPYRHGWIINGSPQAFSNYSTFTDSLSAGFYNICTIDTDINGCTAYDCDTFTVPPISNCAGLAVSIHDSLSGPGPVIVASVQGSHVLSSVFLWSDGSTNAAIVNPQIGSVYCVTVTDPISNCTVSACDTICSFTASVRDSIGAQGNTYTLNLGGRPPYQIRWNGSLSSSIRYTVPSNTPRVTVSVLDANGCYFLDTLYPTTCNLTATVSSAHDVTNHYTFSAIQTGGTGPFTYQWTIAGYPLPYTTPTILDSLPAGNYQVCVTVTDVNSCRSTTCDSVQVAPPTNCNISVRVVDSLGGNLKIAVVTDANNSVFNYHWTTGSTSSQTTATGASSYCVTVTDGNNCTAASCDTVCSLGGYVYYVAQTPGWNQYAVPQYGTAPYHYLWSNGDTAQGFHTTVQGIYHVTITDARGCTVVCTDTLGTVCYFSGNITASGNTGSVAILTANVYNNHGPVTYHWSNNASTSNILTVNASNIYCVTATDSIGCSVILCDSFTLGCSLQVHIIDSAFPGYHILRAVSTGGIAPYTYYWNPAGNTTASILTQAPGIYCANVSDGNGCSAYSCDTITLNCSMQGTYSYTHNSSNLYSFTAAQTLGTAPFTYYWNIDNVLHGPYTSPTYQATLSPGTHTVCMDIYDSNQCSDSACNTITVSNTSCTIAGHISAQVNAQYAILTANVTGNQGPVTYHWNSSTSSVLTVTASGTYCVTVTDTAHCSAVICDTVHISGCHVQASYTSTHTGGVYIFTSTSTGGVGPVVNQWRVDGGTLVAGSPFTATLTTGTHHVCLYTRDSLQCTDSICQNITVTSTNCNLTGYVIDSVAHSVFLTSHYFKPVIINGTAPYTYHWSNGSTGPYIHWTYGSFPINPSVTVTDANGCTAVLHMNTSYVDTFCGNVFSDINGNGVHDGGEVGLAGQPVYLYSGATLVGTYYTNSSGHYAIPVNPGTYTIQYTSAAGSGITIPLNTSTYPSHAVYGPFTITSNANNFCGYNFGVRNTYVTITGYVYIDANNNGIFDAGETPVANELVHVGPHYVYTNANGQYSYVGPVDIYAITYIPSAAYSSYTVTPSSHSVNASTPGQVYGGNNFGLQQTSTSCNIVTTIIPGKTVTAGYPSWYFVYVSNYGTNVANGTMTFYYDPALTFDYANPAQASVNTTAHFVTCVYAGLQPGTNTQFFVHFTANTNVVVGQSTFEMATATDNCNESNYHDNTDTLHQTATGSWDPNAKTVSPGEGSQGLIKRSQELKYTINFQNTGTAPAVNIVLRDSLSTDLDLTTLHVLGSSHPDYALEIEGRQLTCRYSQIMLADSFNDEAHSHGYLSFAVSPVAGIADGTQIQNTASIYFDYNEAVATNTTLSTIDYTLSVKDLNNHATITVAPNPFSDHTTIRVTGADMHDAILDVYNALGQVVGSSAPTDDVFTFSKGALSSGIYTYHIRQSGHTIRTGKLVIE
jgi:hypothetical protein